MAMLKYSAMSVHQQETPGSTEITYQLQVAIADAIPPRKTQSFQCFSKCGPGISTQAHLMMVVEIFGGRGGVLKFGVFSPIPQLYLGGIQDFHVKEVP